MADAAERGQDAERETAARRPDLLGDDDDAERVLGRDEDPRDELRRDEGRGVRHARGEHRADGEPDDGREQEATAARAVGEHAERERRHHAESDDGEHRADVRLGDAERGLDRRQRERDDAEVVAVDGVGGAEEREQPPLARLDAAQAPASRGRARDQPRDPSRSRALEGEREAVDGAPVETALARERVGDVPHARAGGPAAADLARRAPRRRPRTSPAACAGAPATPITSSPFVIKVSARAASATRSSRTQAIRATVAADPTVEACRAKARAAGYEMHLAIDAEVGFANRAKPTAVVKVRRAGAGAVSASGGTQPNTPASPIGYSTASNGGASNLGTNGLALALPDRPRKLSASDRLFLKSLRIAPDELPEVKG